MPSPFLPQVPDHAPSRSCDRADPRKSALTLLRCRHPSYQLTRAQPLRDKSRRLQYQPYRPNGTGPTQPPGGMTLQALGTETGSYDSNPLLLVHGAKPLWGSVTTPELIFNSKTPTAQLNVDTLVKENLFNDSSFDSTDAHQKIGLNEQMERWGAGFTEQTDYDTTRTSELFPLGLGAVSANKAVRHLGLDFAPNVSYAPNTTNKFSLGGSLVDSQYDNPIFANYVTASVARQPGRIILIRKIPERFRCRQSVT